MIIEKLCDMSCENCGFSATSPQQMSLSLANQEIPLVFDIDVFEQTYMIKTYSDLENKIILKKVSNKKIDYGIFKASKFERIIYHINFEDLLNSEELENIKTNINLILMSGVFLRLYVFVQNKSDFIETMEILKDYSNCSINFYCDKYYTFDNYPQLHVHAVDKVKISDLFDKSMCTHKIINKFNVLYDYKQQEIN